MIGITVVLALVAGAVGLRWWLTEPPRVIGVSETVDQYHQQVNGSGGASSSSLTVRMPAAGVYVYDTAGHESVDALGGDTHTYPAETATIVVAEGCGFRMTWTPLSGRSDGSYVCPQGGGLTLVESTTAHEFLRQSDAETFTCDAGDWWLPPEGVTSWTSVCRAGDRVSTRNARVLETGTRTVGDATAQAIRIRYDDVLSEGSTGTATSEVWLDRETGLVLEQHNEASTRNESPIGIVHFEEEIDMTLRSLLPQT